MQIELKKENCIPVNVAAEETVLDGEPVLRVVETEKLWEPDENTYAKIKGLAFRNGTIELKMRSRLLPDAPEHARGFIGLAFRIREDDQYFESFYVRPTNGMTDDPVRKAHGCQYFAYPGYTFQYFRDNGITRYEAPIGFGLDEWVSLKAVIRGDKGEFYLNGASEPVLTVSPLLHGEGEAGGIGFFVDIGTEAFFKDLTVTPED